MSDTVPADPPSFIDRLHVIEVVTTTVLLSELGEWDRFASRYADDVTIDYSPSIGSGPQVMSRATMLEFARAGLASFDATQHQVTNTLVDSDGDMAVARSHMRATHRIGTDVWVRGGVYIHHLKKSPAGDWLIHFQKRIALFEDGDATVIERAASKMRAAAPGLGLTIG